MLIFPNIYLVFSNKRLLFILAVSLILLPIAYFGYQYEFFDGMRMSKQGLGIVLIGVFYSATALLLKNGTFAYTPFAKWINFSAGIIIIGALIKIMHWPGADIMLIVGLLSVPVIYTIYFFASKRSLNLQSILKVLFVYGTVLWRLFTIEHWPYANELQQISELVLLLILVLFFSKNYKKLMQS